MEHRSIEVKLLSAKDLKDVNVFSTMDVYVIGSVSGDPRSIQRTTVDKDGGTNPKWNHDMKFTFDESAAMMNRLGLVFQIMSDRTLGDKEIGRVYVPLKELFDGSPSEDNISDQRRVVYQVQTPTAKFKGQLEFSFKFGEKFTPITESKINEPAIAYPATGPNLAASSNIVPVYGPGSTPGPTPMTGPVQHPILPDVGGTVTYGQGAPQTRYVPPNFGYGYGYGCGFGYTAQHMPPPPPNPYMGYSYGYSNGFGYPGQPPAGYMQQPVVQKPKKNKLGVGAAAGIGAGLLGGLLVGEMVEDVAEAVPYDDMFDF